MKIVLNELSRNKVDKLILQKQKIEQELNSTLDIILDCNNVFSKDVKYSYENGVLSVDIPSDKNNVLKETTII